jgi:hypothetical protein
MTRQALRGQGDWSRSGDRHARRGLVPQGLPPGVAVDSGFEGFLGVAILLGLTYDVDCASAQTALPVIVLVVIIVLAVASRQRIRAIDRSHPDNPPRGRRES